MSINRVYVSSSLSVCKNIALKNSQSLMSVNEEESDIETRINKINISRKCKFMERQELQKPSQISTGSMSTVQTPPTLVNSDQNGRIQPNNFCLKAQPVISTKVSFHQGDSEQLEDINQELEISDEFDGSWNSCGRKHISCQSPLSGRLSLGIFEPLME